MAFWWKPYERLLETKPIDGPAAVRELIAKELVEMLASFPPPEDALAFEDDALARRFRGRMSELPRVDAALGALVLELAALDVAHETDRIDHLFRNDLHRAAAPSEAHVEVLHLLWRGVVEHLYVRKEEARGLLKGKDLVAVAEAARARFAARFT